MSFPRYPRYQQSGTSLGMLPHHWDITRLKFLGKTITGGTPRTGVLEYWENGEIPWLPSGKVQNRPISFSDADVFISRKAVAESAAKPIPPGSALIALTGATCGNVGFLTFESTANQSVVGIVPTAMNGKYLYFALMALRDLILVSKSGGAQGGINQEDVRNILIPLPSHLDEQVAISEFLDQEAAKIDALVERQQELIALLKEKRQAVISWAVTKGLNRKVSTKPSGIKWMGAVPKHWKLSAIKRFVEKITDGAHISPETENGVHPFISTKDVTEDGINFSDCLKTSEASFSYLVKTGCRPQVGDVLFSKDGTVGRTIVVREDVDFVVASSLIIIRPDPSVLDSNFLHRLCQSKPIMAQVETLTKGAGLPRLSIQNLTRVIGTLPPIAEQKSICAFLDSELAKIDGLIAEARNATRLLQERRKVLIFSAVTGQIDVRQITERRAA